MHLSVLLDSGLESGRVGANDLADLLAVLEEEESGHGADGLVLGDLGDLIDVDLVEAGVGVVVGEPVGKSVLVPIAIVCAWCVFESILWVWRFVVVVMLICNRDLVGWRGGIVGGKKRT